MLKYILTLKRTLFKLIPFKYYAVLYDLIEGKLTCSLKNKNWES